MSEPGRLPVTHGRSTPIYFDYGARQPALVPPPKIRRAIEQLEGRAFPVG